MHTWDFFEFSNPYDRKNHFTINYGCKDELSPWWEDDSKRKEIHWPFASWSSWCIWYLRFTSMFDRKDFLRTISQENLHAIIVSSKPIIIFNKKINFYSSIHDHELIVSIRSRIRNFQINSKILNVPNRHNRKYKYFEHRYEYEYTVDINIRHRSN